MRARPRLARPIHVRARTILKRGRLIDAALDARYALAVERDSWPRGVGDARVVLAHTLIELDPKYPTVSPDTRGQLRTAKRELEAEAPKGAAPDPYAAAHAAAESVAAVACQVA